MMLRVNLLLANSTSPQALQLLPPSSFYFPFFLSFFLSHSHFLTLLPSLFPILANSPSQTLVSPPPYVLETDMDGSAKRKLVLRKDDDDTGKAYRFKILLPNGTSVELTLRDPQPQMPLRDFLQLVEDAYNQSMKRKNDDINWFGAPLFLHDSTDAKIKNVIDFHNYKPHKCHILQLHDGRTEIAKSFKNMWDLTPDIDLLLELPEEYSFETALADLIDNSLQAVWSNGGNSRKLIRVNVGQDKISIFDNGPGMDDTDDNSLVKW